MSEEGIILSKKKSEVPRRHPKKIIIPRRQPSVHIPESTPVFITPDKTTCVECTCFPKEDPYVKNKKLNPCQKSPKTLYEYAAAVVDMLTYSRAFKWSEEEVADWMETIGFPEYRECILDNNINGLRLLMLEDPSKLADINIRNIKHIEMITDKVRELYSTELVLFSRSIGLPPRKPLTHCTWFKSRTGPSWGIRENWTRCDILRWMKIIGPEPVYWNHWDLVCFLAFHGFTVMVPAITLHGEEYKQCLGLATQEYQKPDFPKVLFGRVKQKWSQVFVPRYKPRVSREYLTPRKFSLQKNIPEQLIWMEVIPEPQKKPKIKKKVKLESRLVPKKVSLTGLSGDEFILAKRKMPKPKFLP